MLELHIMIVAIMSMLIATTAGLFWTKYFQAENKIQKTVSSYCCGMVTLWAIFQMIAVPFILLQKYLSELIYFYIVLVIGWCIFSLLMNKRYKKKEVFLPKVKKERRTLACWIIFGLILVIQIILIVVLPFAEGDDTYYIGVATMAENSNRMYDGLVYTGGATGGIDIRHGLAPFPIWISVISRLSNLQVTTIAHIIIPVILLVMYYCIIGLLGAEIIKSKKMLPIFLIFIQIIAVWSNYSIYTAETFLLTRTSQGKAVMASIIIPFLILMLYKLSDDYMKERTNIIGKWILVVLGAVSACLCTTLGTVLSIMLVAICGGLMFMTYRKYSILIGSIIAMIPAGCYVLVYIILR